MERDKAYLLDIYNAAARIKGFTQDFISELFADDTKTQSAVLHQLLILGEAVKRLSSDFRKQHDYINWSLIAGMRDNLIHEYDAMDVMIVWNTIQRDIPELGFIKKAKAHTA